MRLYGIECIATGMPGLLTLWTTESGHTISYNDYGASVSCPDLNYFKLHLTKQYTLICKFDILDMDLFKAMMGKGCPKNIKQLMVLNGYKV